MTDANDVPITPEDLEYVANCIMVHADAFPVPQHMLNYAKRMKALAHAASPQPHRWGRSTNRRMRRVRDMSDASDVGWEITCPCCLYPHSFQKGERRELAELERRIADFRKEPAPQQPDVVALGAELVKWAADEENVVYFRQSKSGWVGVCVLCQGSDLESAEVKHLSRCFHERAKAIVAASAVRAATREDGEG